MATRTSTAEWMGDLGTGHGTLTVGDGLWNSGYSFRSRFAGVFDGVEPEERLTNPEEVLAAAHAACFCMALSLALGEVGVTPESIRSSARVHLESIDGPPEISRIDLTTEVRADGIDETGFQAVAELARATCILSRALAGVGEITLAATLVR